MDQYLQSQIKEHEALLKKACEDHDLKVEELTSLLFRGKDIHTDIIKQVMILDTLKKTWNREHYSIPGSASEYMENVLSEAKSWANTFPQKTTDSFISKISTAKEAGNEHPDISTIKNTLFTQLLQLSILEEVYAAKRPKQPRLTEQPTAEDITPEPPPEAA